MINNPNWSESFFEGPWIDLHLSFRKPFDTEREVDALVAILGIPKGASVIDVPCGPGDHTIELANRGYLTTGVDQSEVLLGHAKARASKAGVSSSFVLGDMRSIRLDREHDALICMWGSFGYFDEAGDMAQIDTFHTLLKPSGYLLLDLLPLEGLLINFEPMDSHHVGSMLVIQERMYDLASQRVVARWTFRGDNFRIERTTSVRLYTVRELVTMLENAGFGEVAILEPETRKPFELGYGRAWVRARKR